MLEHGWEKRSPKRACEHADRVGGRTDGLKGVWRVSSLRCLTSLPAPFPAAAAPHTCSGTAPGSCIRYTSQAVLGAAASGCAWLQTSLCTRWASAEKCPLGHWPPRDLTGQAVGSPLSLWGASQTLRGLLLCCQNRAPGQWVSEPSLYSPQSNPEALHLSPRQRLQRQRDDWPSAASPEEVALDVSRPNSSA